ncbi:MAG: penicillin-binding transpeptidase domain-containing protein [Hydrogenophaga sp.]|nr:penicillin-binding transpeptidase domain-containing protein [Hydrogenophaga sp.]
MARDDKLEAFQPLVASMLLDRRSFITSSLVLAQGWTPASANEPNRHAVVLGVRQGERVAGLESVARLGVAPCSTFKIPMTLIALQEGLVTDPDQPVALDPDTYSPEPWWTDGMRQDWGRPHSLRSAYASSAVWFFRRLARRMGAARMRHWLEQFDYGDRNIAHGLDTFWNGGDKGLLISPHEQWTFLSRVAHRQFDLSPRTYDVASSIFVRETRGELDLLAKTGLGWRGTARQSDLTGWFVGWVRGSSVAAAVPFASLVIGRGDDVIRLRVDHAMAALREAGAWA